MTNTEKSNLRRMVKEGNSFEQIKGCINCCDSTIKRYIKTFKKQKSKHLDGGK